MTVVSPNTLASANVPINDDPTPTKPVAVAKVRLNAGLIVADNAVLIVPAAIVPRAPLPAFGVAWIAWTASLIPSKISVSPSRIIVSNKPSNSP